MPVVAELLEEVPEGASVNGIYFCAAATLLVTLVMMLRGSSAVRRWAPIAGVVAGCVVAANFGLYEVERVVEAAWFGLPRGGWPGFAFDLGPAFWALLPAFVFVTLVGAIETVGDVVGIQKVSWRTPRATELTSPRRKRIETELNAGALEKIDEVLGQMSSRKGWGEQMVHRVRLVAEETIAALSARQIEGAEGDESRRLRLVVRPDRHGAEMEFVASFGEGNLEDRMALIGDQPAKGSEEHEISLRLLRHFASSVRHQQYLDTDIVTVKIA